MATESPVLGSDNRPIAPYVRKNRTKPANIQNAPGAAESVNSEKKHQLEGDCPNAPPEKLAKTDPKPTSLTEETDWSEVEKLAEEAEPNPDLSSEVSPPAVPLQSDLLPTPAMPSYFDWYYYYHQQQSVQPPDQSGAHHATPFAWGWPQAPPTPTFGAPGYDYYSDPLALVPAPAAPPSTQPQRQRPNPTPPAPPLARATAGGIVGYERRHFTAPTTAAQSQPGPLSRAPTVATKKTPLTSADAAAGVKSKLAAGRHKPTAEESIKASVPMPMVGHNRIASGIAPEEVAKAEAATMRKLHSWQQDRAVKQFQAKGMTSEEITKKYYGKKK